MGVRIQVQDQDQDQDPVQVQEMVVSQVVQVAKKEQVTMVQTLGQVQVLIKSFQNPNRIFLMVIYIIKHYFHHIIV